MEGACVICGRSNEISFCTECQTLPIGSMIAKFETARKRSTKVMPLLTCPDVLNNMTEWFTGNMAYLIAHWLSFTDVPIHRTLLEDYISREFYHLAQAMDKIGGQILR